MQKVFLSLGLLILLAIEALAQDAVSFSYYVDYDSVYWKTNQNMNGFLKLRTQNKSQFSCIANDSLLLITCSYGTPETWMDKPNDQAYHRFDSMRDALAINPSFYLINKNMNRAYSRGWANEHAFCFKLKYPEFYETGNHRKIGKWECREYAATDSAFYRGMHVWVSKDVNKLCNMGFSFSTFDGGIVQWQIDGQITCTLDPTISVSSHFTTPSVPDCEVDYPSEILGDFYFFR